MKIIDNLFVRVRKLWTALFGKNGDGTEVKLIGTIKGATGQVEAGTNMELSENKLNCKVEVTEVVANPTMEGTEGNLTGLQVGNTKYKVPSGGGGSVYLHNIRVNQLTDPHITLSIYTASNTQFTLATLSKWLFDNNYIDVSRAYCGASSAFISPSTNKALLTTGAYSFNGTTTFLAISGVNFDGTNLTVVSDNASASSISDTVIEV